MAVLAACLVVALLLPIPAVRTAIAEAPVLGPATTDLLNRLGMGGVASRATVYPTSDSVTSAGYTVTLRAAYADETGTTILLHVSPAANFLPGGRRDFEYPRLNYGNGVSVTASGIGGQQDEFSLRFPPTSDPAAAGSQVTLEMHNLHAGRGHDIRNPGPTVRGDWLLKFTLKFDPGVTLPPPASAQVGPVQVVFRSVIVNPGNLHIKVDVRASLRETHDMQVIQGAGEIIYPPGRPADQRPVLFHVQLFDPTGAEVRTWAGGGSPGIQEPIPTDPEEQVSRPVDWLWMTMTKTVPGTYRLVFTYKGTTVERTFTVS
jgi:hypothetical protein